MKMAIDETIVRPGRREAAAHDVRELAESMKSPLVQFMPAACAAPSFASGSRR